MFTHCVRSTVAPEMRTPGFCNHEEDGISQQCDVGVEGSIKNREAGLRIRIRTVYWSDPEPFSEKRSDPDSYFEKGWLWIQIQFFLTIGHWSGFSLTIGPGTGFSSSPGSDPDPSHIQPDPGQLRSGSATLLRGYRGMRYAYDFERFQIIWMIFFLCKNTTTLDQVCGSILWKKRSNTGLTQSNDRSKIIKH